MQGVRGQGGSRRRAAARVNPSPDLRQAGTGIAVGHATDESGATGLTVVRGVNGPMRASAHVFGRATGTREFSLLEPWAANDRIDAILLTGGSAYGLDAAAGVMQWMEERGRGFPIAGGVVPIVPAAVVFDLAPLGRFDARPTAEMAHHACESAAEYGIAEGSVGAGTGCTVGKVRGPSYAMKGGLGIGLSAPPGGTTVGVAGRDARSSAAARSSVAVAAVAIAVVNAFGHVRDQRGVIAGPRDDNGVPQDAERWIAENGAPSRDAGSSTTISVVALNVALSKVELYQVARSASAAYARRIGPAGSSFDGDVVFVVAPLEGPRAPLLLAEVVATNALEDAIVRGVRLARGREGVPGLAD